MAERLDPRELLVSSRVRRREGGQPPHLDPDLRRVRRGYYRPVATPLTSSDAYRLRIQASAEARTEPMVICDESAAALWGCPLLASDTRLVHVNRAGKARRTTAGVVVHRRLMSDDDVVEVDGLLVASRELTAVMLAARLPLPNALLPLDHLLALLNGDPNGDPAGRAVVEHLISRVQTGMRGAARAVRLLQAADARSGSAGESLSRGQMILLGIPMPELQVRFPRSDGGGADVVDFDWPEHKSFGEFDGDSKYFDANLAAGRTPKEVLRDEKERENRVRRHRPHAARWGWDVAMSRQRLARVLAQVGIRPDSPGRKLSP